MGDKMRIRKGDRVRDVKWGSKFTGTVVRTMRRSHRRWVFVQWDDTAVEDQLLDYEVEALGTRVEGNSDRVRPGRVGSPLRLSLSPIPSYIAYDG